MPTNGHASSSRTSPAGRGVWAPARLQVRAVPLSPARDVKGRAPHTSAEFSPWLGTPPKTDVLVSDEPRIVLYTADGTPLVRPVGFRVTER